MPPRLDQAPHWWPWQQPGPVLGPSSALGPPWQWGPHLGCGSPHGHGAQRGGNGQKEPPEPPPDQPLWGDTKKNPKKRLKLFPTSALQHRPQGDVGWLFTGRGEVVVSSSAVDVPASSSFFLGAMATADV
ncbi:hypothetical protein Nmel_017017 [Mimus melanotis]